MWDAKQFAVGTFGTRSFIAQLDQYAVLNTYDTAVYGYSSYYPSNWVVECTAPKEPYDVVSVNPSAAAGRGSIEVIATFTYLDETGCPVTKTRACQATDYTEKRTACVEAEANDLNMKNPMPDGREIQGVALNHSDPFLIKGH